jgi:hypothetical protein|tara:strand:- start:3184 stop:5373 length:2190 start_codon:yes stop_codon:yes gene_type:complete
MSLNAVLNRPLFRQQALKKGALKPIQARIGKMIGPVMNVASPLNPRTPVPAVRPNIFKRAVGDIKSFAQRPGQFFNPKVGRFTPGAGTAAFLGVEGLAPIIGAGRRKLGIADDSPYSGLIDYGIGGLLTLTPMGRAVGLGALATRGVLGASDYLRNQPIGTTTAKLTPNLGQPLGLFGPIDPTQPRGRGAKKKAIEERKKLVQAEGSEMGIVQPDVLTAPENETQVGKTKVVDLDKVTKNKRGEILKTTVPVQTASATQTSEEPNVDMVGDPAQFIGEDPFITPPETPIETVEKPGDKEKDIDVKSAMKSRLSEQLQLAREIQAEMTQGRTSNSRAVFLSTLAAGLMSGTTSKSGLGGALEVFGQALGPAVNNSVMVKMKEDELDDRMLERALNFSLNHLKAQNDAAALPETKDIGVVQFRNPNGVVVNTAGRVLKDGTKQIATGRIVNGISEYRTVPANAKFIKNDDANKETLDISKDLAGKYGALKLINRSLGIIEKGDAQAGVTGLFGLYSGRVGDALGDIFDYKKSQDKTAGQISFKAEQLKAAKRLVNSGEFDNITDARNYLKKQFGSFNTIYNKNLRSIKGRVKDGSKLDYERLAINETVLVYRLANSLKSKDRLTQKDIQMAKELVKVFPAFRGEASVISSLIAVSETIMDDIREKEKTYLEAGGATEYLINERIDAGLIPPNSTEQNISPFMFKQLEDRKKAIQGLSEEELEQRLGTNLFG